MNPDSSMENELRVDLELEKFGARFDRERYRYRTRRNGRWLYYYDFRVYCDFERVEDAILFKMMWS